LTEYNRKKSEGRDLKESAKSPSPVPELTQEVTPLLLLSIFAIAARFTDEDLPNPTDNKMWEGGYEYVDSARNVLAKVYHNSRPSTVQSLLLLGYREFGIGSMELGWLFLGSGIRMAFDLGLNCDSSKWKMHGYDLFSPEETQIRRQIWWACCFTDSYGSVYMGRPTMIKDGDYETPLPSVDPLEERRLWQPTSTAIDISYPPVASRVMSTFCASSKLDEIVHGIITQIYPVRPTLGPSRQATQADLDSRLDQWYITLPEDLQYDASNKRHIPPPHILFLHLRYWSAVLLLHRAFIPNWKGYNEKQQRSLIGTKSFDLAHSAACHVGKIVTAYRETFTMKKASPFLTSHLLGAGVMNVVTLAIRPENFEARTGFDQCMTALKEMAIIWPSASRAWDLLNGVQLRTHVNPLISLPGHRYSDRNKRMAEDAFGETGAGCDSRQEPNNAVPFVNNAGELSQRLMMAHMVGLETPGVDPLTSYYLLQSRPAFVTQPPSYPPSTGFAMNAVMSGDGTGAGGNWSQSMTASDNYGMNNASYMYGFGEYGV
jgi:hypothetical protein